MPLLARESPPPPPSSAAAAPAPHRPWRPRRVLLTRAALGFAHGRAMAERAAALGAEVVELPGDRVVLPPEADPRQAYAAAKGTLAVVVAPPSQRRPTPIPPSADWRFDLARGCPAHCAYCYLAGSLPGPPITRAAANLEEVLADLAPFAGRGTITSRSDARRAEGTTFEASCLTDPLGIEHVTGSLAATIGHFGAWDADVSLRFTTKFDGIDPLLALPHRGRTRVRASVNAAPAARFEGGTAPVPARLAMLGRAAAAGFPVGLVIAPILPLPGWREAYAALLGDAAAALAASPEADLTVELITHRFTDASKAVLKGWYPGSDLPMDEAQRARKTTKFGGVKWVHPAPVMRELRAGLERALSDHLPRARVLYWT